MIISGLLLLCGLGILTYGSNWLIEGSSSLARNYRISEVVIGLVVIGFGTSLPELLINIFASIKGQANGILLGNVIGSNNFNLLFILGITGLIVPLKVQGNTIWKEIPISLLAAIAILVVANDNLINSNSENIISRANGLILVVFFLVFLYYISTIIKNDEHREDDTQEVLNTKKTILLIIGGLTGLLLGGKIMVIMR